MAIKALIKASPLSNTTSWSLTEQWGDGEIIQKSPDLVLIISG